MTPNQPTVKAAIQRHLGLIVTCLGASLALPDLIMPSLVAAQGTSAAQETSAGSITIIHPWARATPPGAKVGGGYLIATNKGDQPDRLVLLSSEISDRAEVHEMSMKDGVMSMHELEDGLTIPAHGSVELKPGSFHVMFVGLKQPLRQGGHFSTTLTFEKAGPVTVDFDIEPIGATKPKP